MISWRFSNRADPLARQIADRHYNRQKIGSPQFVPPGRCLVLLTDDALWVTSWPFAEYVKHEWAGAWINSCFRREGGDRMASDLIREAVAITRGHWPETPELGMVTFLDTTKVKGTKVRGETVYGYSYLKAGFKLVGKTKGGLLTFQMMPTDMPDPINADEVLRGMGIVSLFDNQFTCQLCWQQFDSAVALMEHEAQEDDRLYDLGGE